MAAVERHECTCGNCERAAILVTQHPGFRVGITRRQATQLLQLEKQIHDRTIERRQHLFEDDADSGACGAFILREARSHTGLAMSVIDTRGSVRHLRLWFNVCTHRGDYINNGSWLLQFYGSDMQWGSIDEMMAFFSNGENEPLAVDLPSQQVTVVRPRRPCLRSIEELAPAPPPRRRTAHALSLPMDSDFSWLTGGDYHDDNAVFMSNSDILAVMRAARVSRKQAVIALAESADARSGPTDTAVAIDLLLQRADGGDTVDVVHCPAGAEELYAAVGSTWRTCKICYEGIKSRQIVGCGHLVCAGCADTLAVRKMCCPFCRVQIGGFNTVRCNTDSCTVDAEQEAPHDASPPLGKCTSRC